jgi:hypothetical protein
MGVLCHAGIDRYYMYYVLRHGNSIIEFVTSPRFYVEQLNCVWKPQRSRKVENIVMRNNGNLCQTSSASQLCIFCKFLK